MRAALCGEVKITRHELQIAHDEIAFEHETLLMAFGVKVRAIVGTGQSANQYRAPLRDGILEQNRIGHSRRHFGPSAGSGAPGLGARKLRFSGVDGVENLVEKPSRRGLPPGGEIDRDKILLPKLDLRLQGQFAGKPRLERRAGGSTQNAQRIGGGGLVKIASFSHT